jgi:murein DD-endopeptidase MepM/ murein hydrolase activator NlpD
VDDLGAMASRLADIEQQMALVSDAAALQNLEIMRMPSHLPVDGAHLGSSFGNREDPFTGRRAFHAGLDFTAAPGTAIHAAAGGTVVFAGFKPDYGWVVEIEHGNGLMTRYAHASRLLVKSGALVTPGDRIAEVGSTGRSTGPHLHFEVLRNGEAADPRRYLAGL